MPPPSEHEDFLRSVEPLRTDIRLHCYRMLGSSHDGDDVVQETLMRAWRAKESLDDPECIGIDHFMMPEVLPLLGAPIVLPERAAFA